MKKKLLSIIVIIIASTPVFALSDWDKAVDVYRETADLKPYRMTVYSETFDRKGRLEKSETLVYSLTYNADGESEQQLIRAEENGEDITEKKRQDLEKNPGRGRGGNESSENMEGMDKHPLDPEVQPDITAVDSGKDEYRGGRLCSVWDFTLQLNEKYTGIGTAWIDTESGRAVSIEYRIEPLFPFVEEMNIGMEFETDKNKIWVLDELKMAGRVNLIVMKKSFDSITSFSDYR